VITTTTASNQGQVLGAAVYNFGKNLSVGSRGDDVTALQQFLIDGGYSIPAGATGYFGSQTRTAVTAFQKAHGIAQTGNVGPLTRAELNKGSSWPNFSAEQINSIVSVLQSFFGVDQATMNQVRTALSQ
jgi:peptidoglycan hydrolase-like protein with peptidoglycan-binding domain